jgi:leader peptidase (prepilin peptidase)/N-methyltransferase
MGAGDVKLALGLGGVTGAAGVEVWVAAAFGAPLLTLVWAVLSRRRVVPHGPSMCLATALSLAISA